MSTLDVNLVGGTRRKSAFQTAIRRLSDIVAPSAHHQLDDGDDAALLTRDESGQGADGAGAPPAAAAEQPSNSNHNTNTLGAPPAVQSPRHARSKSAATPQRSYLNNIASMSRDLEVAVVKLINAQQDEEKAAGKPISGVQDIDKLPARLRAVWNDAERGIPRSQFTLGGFYHLGGANGVELNPLQALKWYARAASAGDIASINNIGVMLMKGLGMEQDEPAAIKWLEYAADQGNVYSMVNLGILLTKPTDAKCQDFNRAYELYYKAAKMGNTIAQNNLGCMLARGYGCEKDDKKAMKYFKRSSEGGSAAAKYNVGVLHQNGWGVKADFEKAKDWFDAAAADPKHDEYPYVIADNDPTKFLLLTSIISYKP